MGSRSEGVPEKPMRREKSVVPPSSCPEAESLTCWWLMNDGKITCSRNQWMVAGYLRSIP